ncbi:hypothetical protein Cantr_01734 [Candida viswanathii]|uniref:Uncharacterized protein n=1 Tax=Candida viswanathii TaxID=5486 RepID=A0A367YJI4_9ASCO|nr:hypothetical protein Cantr_01734 [Candida viswanathii]
MDIKDIIVQIGSVVVFVLEVFFRNSITLVVHAQRHYPEATNILFLLIGAYIFYRVLVRAFKTWLNFLILTIKTIAVLFFVFLVFVIYVRGWDRFVNQDLPFVKNSATHAWKLGNHVSKNGFNIWDVVNNVNFNDFAKQTEEKIKENINEPNAYFEYMNSKFGNEDGGEPDYDDIQKMVEEGIDFLQENIDLNKLGGQVHDFLNNLQ